MSALYVRRSPNVAYRRLGDEAIAMTSTDSTLFNLNEVATVIWESADGCTALSEIVQGRVCEQFDVDPAEALKDATEFVHNLVKHGILLVSDEPIAVPASKAEVLK